jgi:hypothetical protein
MQGSAPNALPVEWFRNSATNNGAWTSTQAFPNDEFDLGVRVDATPSTVPEPGTLALLSLCLAGLAFTRRRKQQSLN